MDSGFLDLPTHLPNSEEPEDTKDSTPALLAPGSEAPANVPVEENISDEEAGNSAGGAMCIPGTNIKLESDEDIQKWIEERKKNWPTKKNLEKKQLEQENEKKRKPHDTPRNTKKPKNICRFYQQHKTCKFGNKCKNLHEVESDYKIINNIKVKVPQNYENHYYNPHNPSENSSLYKMLVKKDQLELENTQFIDFLYYMDKRGLIKHDFDN